MMFVDAQRASGFRSCVHATAQRDNSWIVGNREVTKKAPRKSLRWFRLCLTRSASSSVARPENCRPKMAGWIIERLPASQELERFLIM